MKKPTERTERWIEVEALCRCARLEREFGQAMSRQLESLDDDPRLVAQMRRLCAGRLRWARLRAAVWGFCRRAASALSASGEQVDGKWPRKPMANSRYSAASLDGDCVNQGHHSARVVA